MTNQRFLGLILDVVRANLAQPQDGSFGCLTHRDQATREHGSSASQPGFAVNQHRLAPVDGPENEIAQTARLARRRDAHVNNRKVVKLEPRPILHGQRPFGQRDHMSNTGRSQPAEVGLEIAEQTGQPGARESL